MEDAPGARSTSGAAPELRSGETVKKWEKPTYVDSKGTWENY